MVPAPQTSLSEECAWIVLQSMRYGRFGPRYQAVDLERRRPCPDQLWYNRAICTGGGLTSRLKASESSWVLMCQPYTLRAAWLQSAREGVLNLTTGATVADGLSRRWAIVAAQHTNGWRDSDWRPVSSQGHWRLAQLTLSNLASGPSKAATAQGPHHARLSHKPTGRSLRANGPKTQEWSDSEREAITNLKLKCRRRENEWTRDERPRSRICQWSWLGGNLMITNLKLDRRGKLRRGKIRRQLRLSTRMRLGYDGLRLATARQAGRVQIRLG